MEFIDSLKNFIIWGNTGYDYVLAIIIFVGLLVILKIFQVIILTRLYKLAQKTKTDFDDVLINIFKTIRPPFYFLIALYFGIKVLTLPEIVFKILYVLFLVVIIFEIIRASEKLLNYFISGYLVQSNKDNVKSRQSSQAMMKTLQVVIRIILWVVGLMLLLSNLGVNVNSVIASLGIGGIAVALALQNILTDVFSSFAIHMDKIFQIGDYIVVGSDGGVVEKIGLKTTRIRTLQGEELVISNRELTSARVQNFRKMEERRIVFNLGVIYGTSATKLVAIPKMVENIIQPEKLARFDRCYFVEFGDFSLIFEVVLYIKSPDYEYYLKTRHRINLEIYQQFDKESIEFAYPTQTILVNKDEN